MVIKRWSWSEHPVVAVQHILPWFSAFLGARGGLLEFSNVFYVVILHDLLLLARPTYTKETLDWSVATVKERMAEDGPRLRQLLDCEAAEPQAEPHTWLAAAGRSAWLL